jgi:hypothetical protein
VPRHSHEVEVLREQNLWFIADNPQTIQLVPYAETTSVAGGRVRTAGTPRKPQTVRFVPLDRQRTSQRTVEGAGNSQVEVAFSIIGDADLEIARYDRFVGTDGVEYEVGEVSPIESSPYLRRADVYATPPRTDG